MGKPKLSSFSNIHGAAPKIERKVIEKNRRDRLKILYSHLFSLVPSNHTSCRDALALPDQIDEVVKYIEHSKLKLQDMKQKKEFLSRSNCGKPAEWSLTKSDHQPGSPPLVQVQNMGPNTEVVLASGLADYSMFLSIIHNLVRQVGVEVANANFTLHGSSTIHVLCHKAEKSNSSHGGFATTSMGMPGFIHAESSSSQVVESSQLNVWDYCMSNFWDLCIEEAFPQQEFKY